MMRPFLVILLLGTAGTSIAQPPPGYYDAAEGLTGEPLRQALHGIINGHTVVANSALWYAFGLADRKPNGKVWDIYSDTPGSAPPYEFTFVTDQCGTYAEEGDCFNREHTFPESWFGELVGPKTDLFHLYPVDGWVNQKRANWPYGIVGTNITFPAANGGKLGQCIYPGCTGLVFEPIDAYKGDLARGYFYLLTRYKDEAVHWSNAPVLEDGAFLPWVENLLLEWHAADPVSQKEIDRNNTIFTSLQHNRNPYIDNPEWVYRIWGPTASIGEQQQRTAKVWMDGDELRYDRMGHNGTAHLNVFNAMGALVYNSTVQADAGAIPFTSMPGVYIVVFDDGVRMVSRVMR